MAKVVCSPYFRNNICVSPNIHSMFQQEHDLVLTSGLNKHIKETLENLFVFDEVPINGVMGNDNIVYRDNDVVIFYDEKDFYLGHFFIQCVGDVLFVNAIKSSVYNLANIHRVKLLPLFIITADFIATVKRLKTVGIIEPMKHIRGYLFQTGFLPYDGDDPLSIDADLDGAVFYRDVQAVENISVIFTS